MKLCSCSLLGKNLSTLRKRLDKTLSTTAWQNCLAGPFDWVTFCDPPSGYMPNPIFWTKDPEHLAPHIASSVEDDAKDINAH